MYRRLHLYVYEVLHCLPGEREVGWGWKAVSGLNRGDTRGIEACNHTKRVLALLYVSRKVTAGLSLRGWAASSNNAGVAPTTWRWTFGWKTGAPNCSGSINLTPQLRPGLPSTTVAEGREACRTSASRTVASLRGDGSGRVRASTTLPYWWKGSGTTDMLPGASCAARRDRPAMVRKRQGTPCKQ
jgi:hypothetical protein